MLRPLPAEPQTVAKPACCATRSRALDHPGDRRAVAALRAELRRYLLRKVRDAALVDDLLQDLFMRDALHLARLRARTRVAPWLYRIARNLVIDHARRRVPELDAPELATWPDQVMSPGATLGAWMMEQVADFPAPYRDAILQVDVEGEHTADVARALGLSTPGVKSRVQRARQRLARATDRCCAVELDRHGPGRRHPPTPSAHHALLRARGRTRRQRHRSAGLASLSRARREPAKPRIAGAPLDRRCVHVYTQDMSAAPEAAEVPPAARRRGQPRPERA